MWGAVVAVGLLLCIGCTWTQTVRDHERISQRMRKDIIDFYENMAQSYYLLGYGYFNLYKDALAENNEAAADMYRKNAIAYKRHYEELMNSLKVMREEYGLPASDRDLTGGAGESALSPEVPVSPASPDGDPTDPGASPPPPGPADETPGGASESPPPPGPTAQKDSFLDRLLYWR
jgi:hypothetical protein